MVKERRLLSQDEIPYLTGGAWELRKGQYIRVTARHTVDFVAFNLHDLSERLDQSRTKTNQMKVFLTTGDVLYSNEDNVMLTIVDQAFPYHHDMQKGTCSRKRHETKFQGLTKDNTWGMEGSPSRYQDWEELLPRGCWENISNAVESWGIDPWDVPSPLNLFQNMRINGATGQLWSDHKDPSSPEEWFFTEMRAEMDLLVSGANDVGRVEPYHVEIYEG